MSIARAPGIRPVAACVSGERTWKIDPAAVRALAAEMQEAGYFDMQDNYDARVSDNPTIFTSLSLSMGTRRTPLSAGWTMPVGRERGFLGELSGWGTLTLDDFFGVGEVSGRPIGLR